MLWIGVDDNNDMLAGNNNYRTTVIAVLLLCSVVHGANEIRAVIDGSPTAYYVVREIDGDVWYVAGQVFEVWGTGGRTAADYDTSLTDKSGGFYVANMDTNIAAGQYYVIAHQQAGGAPADTDPPVWQEYGDWDGTAWIPSTITAGDVWEEAVADHTTETTFGGEVGGLDPNITLIKAVTDELIAVTTTVTDANDANNFTLVAGDASDDAYIGMLITVKDADDSQYGTRAIETYTSGRVVRVDAPFGFTPANGDEVTVWNLSYAGLIGKIWDIVFRIPRVINIYDFRNTSRANPGPTVIDRR
jgi:hypothetical protein